MIGIFDSGAGGLNALRELRRLLPEADIVFFADRENAPYGTKAPDTLVRLVERDIEILKNSGAEKILMACCTASTVYHKLKEESRRICVPIIEPTVKRALKVSKNKKIGVIATERTVASKAFSKAILSRGTNAEVFEVAAQKIVAIVENGSRDGRLTRDEKRIISEALLPLVDTGIDTLILGCTHFPHLRCEIAGLLPGVELIDSAKEGAFEISKKASPEGFGKTLFLGRENIQV